LLKGPEQINQRTNEYLGLYGMKFKFLAEHVKDLELHVIDVEKWKSMNEYDQLTQLYTISKVPQGNQDTEREFAF
jgi:hypothetical protein